MQFRTVPVSMSENKRKSINPFTYNTQHGVGGNKSQFWSQRDLGLYLGTACLLAMLIVKKQTRNLPESFSLYM